MEFGDSFDTPVTPEIAEQLLRVSQGLTAEHGTEQGHEFAAGRYTDVETFLEENADLFAGINELWAETNEIKLEIEEIADRGHIPIGDTIDEKGVVHRHVRELHQGDSRKIKRLAESRKMDTRFLVASMNELAYHEIANFLPESFFDRALQYGIDSERLRFMGDDYVIRRQETREAHLAEHPRPDNFVQFHTPSSEEINEKTGALRDAYFRAFIGQRVGFSCIRELLADDHLILPFVERVQELAVLGKYGSFEFPGLLETLQAQIADARIANGTSVLKEALLGISDRFLPVKGFVASLLTNPNVKGELVSPSKELMAGILAVQKMVEIFTGEDGSLTTEKSIELLTARFAIAPEDWQIAYNLKSQAKAIETWSMISTALKPFERQGRLLTNAPRLVSDKKTPAPNQKRGRQKNQRVAQQAQTAIRDVKDMSATPEQEPAITSFAMLKSTGGSARSVFNLERIDGLDTLMETQLVAKFLRGQEGLAGDLRTYLQQLAANPNTAATEILKQRSRFRVQDDAAADAPYSMRRFSPRKGVIEGGSSHQHASRIRIVFGIIVVEGQKCLAIEDISLRESNTY